MFLLARNVKWERFVVFLCLHIFSLLLVCPAYAEPPVLWVEPVKNGYLTDGSAYCDFQIKSSDTDFSTREIKIEKTVCRHQLRNETLFQIIEPENQGNGAHLRVSTPVYSSATVFTFATYKGLQYLLHTQVRLLGKGRDAQGWLSAARKGIINSEQLPYLDLGRRGYLSKGIPIRFSYKNISGPSNGPIRVFTPDSQTNESVRPDSKSGFSYKVPASEPLRPSFPRQGSPRVFAVATEINQKETVLTSFVTFYDNRSLYRNLKHGVAVFLCGGICTAALFLYYLRRSSCHGS